ncbi:TPA: alpha,alpha-phosphotrehalase [Bacillus thuringiensis]|uniref:Alpha,alpha-phosphotrehalase n=4 Tax=Bacillus cereus group TaxID=86661 RepID=A0A9X6KRC8_BACTU|nr:MULTISPECIES: alpha,alpha-phosphotrehalase [Bacillus cereus group]AGE76287.1 Trehalose-6-phosphate hydrolase [Bacillus thuringiensis serovar kurstaki str. HD73]AHZ49463.1 trehalose-6-phosphate hydrolase [Bacillus thuringiensis serovar kurstaki str. YBT-1520]AIE31850.1 trehalose-6-phosphate hydrolase [Bacillus thuringiensis serovar kurstaki str. HD-1]AIM33964.1 Trehalose-6-phosphate hydrolase [Bacillus thuringiensis serovar kurstaki str. YBT-1520]AJA17911.1 trehalose-6-phosphate hydrolase [B
MKDWHKSVVYQIYPKSFNSYYNRETGDIKGVTEKLDYLKELGVDYIWLTPIYQSPQNDNGYDVSDYYSIDPSYGTMEEFEELLAEAKVRNIEIMLDIVVNHSSTEHKWFKEAKEDKNSPYRNYYIWRDEKNNWQSKFGGSAWKYDEKTEQYYLHLFDETQADLNWENEKLREEVYDMMRFWLDKGVTGFRLDVINLISKDQCFLNDEGSTATSDGRKYYTDGPRVHEYLQEMNRNVFAGKDVITVGEMSSTTIDNCIKYSNPERNELSMTFSFHHLKVDYPNGDKWTKAEFDFIKLKEIMSNWQIEMQKGGGWNALFWCNHDQPRIVSRFGDDGKYRNESAKMLATAMHMLQGTPYIYQGEEIGMTNPKFESIEQYRDVESLNIYDIKLKEGLSKEEIIGILKQKSRDNSRTPMQWNEEMNSGFTTSTPWISAAENFKEINVEKALEDKESVFYHYKKLIELRKTYDVITEGEYAILDKNDPKIWAYTRTKESEVLLVINNFYGEEITYSVPAHVQLDGMKQEVLLSNYKDASKDIAKLNLRPYESIVYRYTK